MNIVKKRWFALLVLVAAACAALATGWMQGTEDSETMQENSAETVRVMNIDESLQYDSYLMYIRDTAEVLSEETENQLGLYMANWDRTYGSFIGVVTVRVLDDVSGEAAYSYLNQMSLDQRDGLLLLYINGAESKWFFSYGGSAAQNLLDQSILEEKFDAVLPEGTEAEDYNSVLLAAFDGVNECYAETAAGETGTITVLQTVAVLVYIALAFATVIVIFNFADRPLFRYWYRRKRMKGKFVPLVFWHHENSAWFQEMMKDPDGTHSRIKLKP